jgi:uncharacterized protein with HEPN domain
MPKSHSDLLYHILDEVNFLINESDSLTESDFIQDEKSKRAFARSIEIIGEASKQIPSEVKEAYPDVEWKAMARMRDRLIHHYFGVDYGLVWDTYSGKYSSIEKTSHSNH